MKQQDIPEEIRNQAIKTIDTFNSKILKNRNQIIPDFEGKFLFLNRNEGGQLNPLVRLEYKGNLNNWKFAIFKWSTEIYDDEDFFFPGSEFIDGTIEGSIKAGIKAYPI